MTEETKAADGASSGVSDSTQLLERQLPKPKRYFGHSDTMPMYGPDEVMEYAASVVSAEREACAAICDRYGSSYFAEKIRERSNK